MTSSVEGTGMLHQLLTQGEKYFAIRYNLGRCAEMCGIGVSLQRASSPKGERCGGHRIREGIDLGRRQ